MMQPDGGVTEGQVFLAPLPRDIEHPHLNVPTGAWKDGLFACCNNGLFHPHLWCAICCPQSELLFADNRKRTILLLRRTRFLAFRALCHCLLLGFFPVVTTRTKTTTEFRSQTCLLTYLLTHSPTHIMFYFPSRLFQS